MKKVNSGPKQYRGEIPPPPPLPEGERAELMTEAILKMERRGEISLGQHDEQLREITRESVSS